MIDAYINRIRRAKFHRSGRSMVLPASRIKCRWYFDKHDNYPIMHVVAFREDLGETSLVLPKALTAMWGAMLVRRRMKLMSITTLR